MPRGWIIGLIIFCTILNAAGFALDIFQSVPLYDEVAHLLTPLVLVAIVAEIIYRAGGDDEFFDTPRHAVVTGSVIGLVGATGWEGIEILLDFMGVSIEHPIPDTLFDIFLGVLGGAAGAYIADHFLDRLFSRSRKNSNRPRVR